MNPVTQDKTHDVHYGCKMRLKVSRKDLAFLHNAQNLVSWWVFRTLLRSDLELRTEGELENNLDKELYGGEDKKTTAV